VSDTFKDEAIKKYMSNHSLFISLFQNKSHLNDQKILELLKSNHDMSRSILIDLGVEFHETDMIRNLNKQIRDIESKQSNDNISFESISSFINNSTNCLKEALFKEGINGSISISMCPNLKVDIKIFGSGRHFVSRNSYRKEEDYLLAKERELTRHDNLKENFELILDEDGDYLIAYTQTNLAIIKTIIEKCLGQNIEQLQYVIQYANEDDIKIPYIDAVSCMSWTLASSKSLNEVMKNRF